MGIVMGGDVDGDEKPDLYVNLSSDGISDEMKLFLSPLVKPGQLVREVVNSVGEIEISGENGAAVFTPLPLDRSDQLIDAARASYTTPPGALLRPKWQREIQPKNRRVKMVKIIHDTWQRLLYARFNEEGTIASRIGSQPPATEEKWP